MNKGISVDLSQMGEYHLDELEQLVGALLGEIECAEYVPTEEYGEFFHTITPFM